MAVAQAIISEGPNKYGGLVYIPTSYIIAISLFFPETLIDVPFLLGGALISVFLIFLKPLESIILLIFYQKDPWGDRSISSPFIEERRAKAFAYQYVGFALVLLQILQWKNLIEYLGEYSRFFIFLGTFFLLLIGIPLSFAKFKSSMDTVSNYYDLQVSITDGKKPYSKELEKHLSLMRDAMERNDWYDATFEFRKATSLDRLEIME